MTSLRDYQVDVKQRVYHAWHQPNVFNIILTMATGAGKTTVFSDIVREFNAPACVIAHRQELVAQASLALNREGIQHDIMVPKAVKQQIIRAHHDIHGYSHYRGGWMVRVAGVDSLARDQATDRWYSQVALVVQDEGHHVQRQNKWGKAQSRFPNARGLFPTAHCLRGDGRGLGRSADGLADSLVVGPHCRYLIDRGFLTDYRLFCPSSDIDFSELDVGPSGDYSQVKLAARTHASNTIVGDVVRKYLELAPGKLGVTFAVDIEAAKQLCAAYEKANVPAAVITAETPIQVRAQLMRQFRSRILLQLVSVDCLGEGVDVPAIEVVSMVRKTASFQLYAQQFGRALRPMVERVLELPGPNGGIARIQKPWGQWGNLTDAQRRECIAISEKPTAMVIDHVGNTIFHGLPDIPRTYSMDRAETRARAKTGVEALRACPDCTRPYERFRASCPYCGFQPQPRARSTPEQVEGDVIELSPEILQELRQRVANTDGPAPAHGTDIVGLSIRKNHRERQQAQYTLRKIMDLWSVWRHHCSGETVPDMHRRFWFTYGVDVLTAMTLGVREAAQLEARVRAEMQAAGVIRAQELIG